MSASQMQRTVSMDNEFYIPIGNLTNLVFAINATTNQLSTAAWAYFGSRYLSSINASGAGLLRDAGRTYVSGGRTFREVQLVVPQSTGTQSTFGIGGATGFDTAPGTSPTPVAKWGR